MWLNSISCIFYYEGLDWMQRLDLHPILSLPTRLINGGQCWIMFFIPENWWPMINGSLINWNKETKIPFLAFGCGKFEAFLDSTPECHISFHISFKTLELLIWCSFTSLQGESTSGTTLLFIVFLCSMTLGTILMCFLHTRDVKREEGLPESSVSFNSTLVSLSKSVITPLFDIRMLLIVPLIAYSGLQQAFVW